MTYRRVLAIRLVAVCRLALAGVLLPMLLLGAALPGSLASGSTPLAQLGAKLTGGEEVGEGRFGRSVALSADGDTALIGGPRDSGEAGAVWVFTRTGSTWTQQAKLTGGEERGAARFGRSVALSADGDTALVGGPNDGGVGAVWVFTRTGSTWTQQAKLTGAGESGSGWFGQSVALSADGDTALVGGFVDHSDTGAAWVFVRSGSGSDVVWTQQGAKLTGGEESGEGEFGWSVALSGDGATALVGGRKDGAGAGAAWVFARSGSGSDVVWTQQGAKLTGGEESGEGEFGQSVALSADGDTALVGGFHDSGGVGAAWMFARSGSGSDVSGSGSDVVWTQQGAKLTGGEEVGGGYFGDAVALTPDGSTALVGGFDDDERLGAAWVFARSGSGSDVSGSGSDVVWTQQGAKLTGGEERGKGELGWSVALSADGATALIGGIGDSAKAGAAWVFGAAPSSPISQLSGEPPPGAQTQTSTGGSPAADDPSPKQGVAAYKVVGGGTLLVGRRIPVRGGRAKVELRCTAPVACRGRLTLTVGVRANVARRSRTATIAKASFSIPRGRTAPVELTLDRAGRARLHAGHGHLRASLTVRVIAPDPPGTRTYVVKLASQRAHLS
jgi:FG-GAP repeat